MKFTKNEISNLIERTAFFSARREYNEVTDQCTRLIMYIPRLPACITRLNSYVKKNRLFLRLIARDSLDLSWLHTSMSLEMLVLTADYYGFETIFPYLHDYYENNLPYIHNYLHVLRQIYDLSHSKVKAVVNHIHKCTELKHKDILSFSKRTLKIKIRDRLRLLEWHKSSTLDECGWCEKPIRYIGDLNFHPNLACTPCCGYPIHKQCVYWMLVDDIANECNLCGTSIDKGRPDTYREDWKTCVNRREIRRLRGMDPEFKPYFNTNFEKEITKFEQRPLLIRPKPAETENRQIRTRPQVLTYCTPQEHGDEDWT